MAQNAGFGTTSRSKVRVDDYAGKCVAEPERVYRELSLDLGRLATKAPRRNILCIQTKTACSRGRLGVRI